LRARPSARSADQRRAALPLPAQVPRLRPGALRDAALASGCAGAGGAVAARVRRLSRAVARWSSPQPAGLHVSSRSDPGKRWPGRSVMTLGPATDFVPDPAARQAELRAYRGVLGLFGRAVAQPPPGTAAPVILVPGFISGDVSL